MTDKSYLEWGDYGVIVAYFIGVLAVGLLSSHKTDKGSVSSYFLASRKMHWIPVGASLFVSNVGSGHYIGLAGSAAASGIGIGMFELNAMFVLVMLGWMFVPVYLSSEVYTMPEYLRKRFGGQRIRIYLSVLTLLLYVFTKISADLFAGALFIKEAVGKTSDEWLYISVLILLAISAIFCIAGGLTAVMWTDFVQTILMLAGSMVLMVIAFYKVNGYEALVNDYFYAIPSKLVYDKHNNTCGLPPRYAMNFFRSITPGESDLPWTGLVFGLTISAIWCWCTDQVIVQRTLAAKDLTNAKAGCLLAAAIKFLPLWFLVFPGMAARVLYPDVIACVDPLECEKYCGSTSGCTNLAYIKLVLELLPVGVRGLMIAVMLAALMSSLTSIFNSSSTIFTIDIWQRIRRKAWSNMAPHEIDIEKLVVGRLFVLVLIVISVIWIPIIQSFGNSQLFVYIQSITSFLAPPICAVYILAVFWGRCNEPGAFWGLMVGLIVGIIRFALEFGFPEPPCGATHDDPRPEFVKIVVGNVHYLHFGCILFMITAVVAIAISLLTEPIPEECLYRLTWWTKNSSKIRISMSSITNKHEEKNNASLQIHEKSPPQVSPQWKQLLFRICGGNPDPEARVIDDSAQDTKHPKEAAKDASDFIREEPNKRKFVDLMAVIVLAFAAFIMGYYA